MTNRPLLRLCLTFVSLCLAACGAGTGGTGTGPAPAASAPTGNATTAGPATSAAPAVDGGVGAANITTGLASDSRTAILGAWLQITSAALGIQGASAQPAPVAQGDTLATFEASKITVTQGCAKFEFAGTWVLDANQQVQVQGVYQSNTAATLIAQFAPAGAASASQSLSVRVVDATGQVVLLGQVLNRAEAAGTPTNITCAPAP